VGDQKRGIARRFLQGLSSDELQYIAEFLGSQILESGSQMSASRRQLAEDVAQFERSRRASAARHKGRSSGLGSVQDEDHKMILLLEYLSRCAAGQPLARAAES
jgi:hypothetical protein